MVRHHYDQPAEVQGILRQALRLASCKKAKELGGSIPAGFPFDLQDGIGAIAVVVDPAGHPIGIYSRTPLAPAPHPAK